ncbi:NACHT domain-containing protein [Corallococcus sp. AB045]|uniref:NACHT domain-containing protein n=1 Tax=Corallococcus sp. AB045 TaxID=2316719 RepID=UPI000ECD5B2C|nr:NACHT domain-containing protein [Corallococcus sp. AB045]RKH90465.1 NACHT domain-containing protein [Corallococcus sp. AB045]
MPIDIPLITKLLDNELSKISIVADKIDIDLLDNAGEAIVIRVISNAFDGQTYLDREMRIRPAVARALIAASLPRTSYVLELNSPDEFEEPTDDTSEAADQETPQEERLNRKAWREQQNAIIRALEAGRYNIDPLINNSLIIASKEGLSTEKILIALAPSPNASTVDLELRKSITLARQSQRFQACYYITPRKLERPFSNQTNADWLQTLDAIAFLHSLNNSVTLAQQLIRHCELESAKLAPEHKGQIIEPTVIAGGSEQKSVSFFDFIRTWLSRPKPSFLVLMAPAGHGKTTLTIELTRQLAKDFLAGQSGQVPLLVPFESVRRTVDFEALMHKRLDQLRGGTFGVFAELLKSDNAALLIDGFDELADDAGAAVAENQVRSMRTLVSGKAKVILAGRSAFTHQFAGSQSVVERVRSLLGDVEVETLEILPFDSDQISTYISTRDGLSTQQKEAAFAFSTASPDHEELCSTPLFLKLICSLASQNKTLQLNEAVASVDFLIDKVCEREEERQNLGIGVKEQVEFLGNIAAEGFGIGAGRVTEDDVRIYADAFAERAHAASPELAGRLMDHAFLNNAGEGRLAFVHPFIRDVVLGRFLKQETALEGIKTNSVISQHDLPEGTIQYLSKDVLSQRTMTPSGWLSETGRTTSQARRNLFRIVTAGAEYRRPEAPRLWWEEHWLVDKTIRGLDLSNLVLQSLSFDELTLNGCKLEGTLLEDCEFIGTKIHACDLNLALFVDCQISAQTEFFAGIPLRVSVRLADRSVTTDSWEDLKEVLQSTQEPLIRRQASGRNATETCSQLLRELLSHLADPEGRFHRRSMSDLRLRNDDRGLQLAFDKVILPTALSRMCESELVAGSKELFALSKPWRKQVVDYLKNGRPPLRLRELISKMSIRVAKYV